MDEARGQDQPQGQEETAAQVPLRAPDLVRWCVTLLATSAWQAMGLIPAPATHRVERNLEDARLAFDVAAGRVAQVLPRSAARGASAI